MRENRPAQSWAHTCIIHTDIHIVPFFRLIYKYKHHWNLQLASRMPSTYRKHVQAIESDTVHLCVCMCVCVFGKTCGKRTIANMLNLFRNIEISKTGRGAVAHILHHNKCNARSNLGFGISASFGIHYHLFISIYTNKINDQFVR